MNIPPYWARAKGQAKRPDGTTLDLNAWGWSVASDEDARRSAQERLTRMIERVARGEGLPHRYPYGVGALREEIVEQVPGARAASALVTRNSYGSLVVNTADVMFVDVDIAPQSGWRSLRRLFGRTKDLDDDALEKLKNAIAPANSAFRIYRTAGGYRLVATERTFVPGSREVEEIMEAVGADPAYIQLCRAQHSFRARLTPKPWRCGHTAPPSTFPRDRTEQEVFERWLATYTERCAAKSVCRHVENVGSEWVAAAAEPILRYHDKYTRAHEDLPLA